jgi:hypothetical protein
MSHGPEKWLLVVLILALSVVTSGAAQDAAAPDTAADDSASAEQSEPTAPVQSRDLAVEPAALLWGAEVTLGFRNYLQLAPQVNTTLMVKGGGRWGSDSYYRTPDFRIYNGDSGDPADISSFNEWDIRWGVGFAQGLVPMPERDGRDLLRIESWYRAVYESHLLPADEEDDLIARSGLPDAEGLLLNKLFLGVIYDSRLVDEVSKQSDGLMLEASLETAPQALGNTVVGDSNFARVNATARYYRSLYDPRSAAGPLPTLGVAAFAAADHIWALGEDHRRIPADTRQSIGGLSPRTALGGALRGLDSGRLDANSKIAVSVELRSFFPYLIPADLVPGVVAYLDGGFYRNPAGSPESSEDFSAAAASTGAGISMNIFDLATLVGYTGVNLTGTNVDGRKWKPFFLGFGLHY